MPSAMRGAPVIERGWPGSRVLTLQTGWPDLASMEISRPSMVPMISLPCQAARPRLTGPQQVRRAQETGTLGSKVQSFLPVTPS